MENNEKKIIKAIRKGDIKAFEVLFKKYYKALCLYADLYVNDLDLAEETVQELFYYIWKKREDLHINQSVKAYLYRATKNRCLKLIRSQQVAARYADFVKHVPGQQVATPVDELNAKELDLIIEQTLNTLPVRTEEIFRLNRFEGLKYAEIAQKLSISVKTVEANMGKALKVFYRKLHEYLQVT
jgi:RNA polymerase sigma-70 factor (ECF subfamily)